MTSEYKYQQEVNASKEFLKGFLFGQLIIFALLVTLVRIFFLRGSGSTRKTINEKKKFEVKPEVCYFITFIYKISSFSFLFYFVLFTSIYIFNFQIMKSI